MKRLIILLLLISVSVILQAQIIYDSVTISRCSIGTKYYELGPDWPNAFKTEEFKKYISNEKTIWVKPGDKEKANRSILSLTDRIKENGTKDVARCFIPRHSINFYQEGKITRCLLVCFQCNGLHFSDDPKVFFIKSLDARDKQMLELKEIFKDLL
jgi:hypothetical protein